MKISFLILFCFYITNLNSQYQKIEIITNPNNAIFIDDEPVDSVNFIFNIKKNRQAKQVVSQRKGYINGYYVIKPKRKTKHESYYVVGKNMIEQIAKRKTNEKQVYINEISADIDSYHVVRIPFKNYQHNKKTYSVKENKKIQEFDVKKGFKVKETIFADDMNHILKHQGYIDTSNRLFSRYFSNFLIINATLNNYQLYQIHAPIKKSNGFYNVFMIFADLDITWEVFDYYKRKIYEFNTSTQSGKFVTQFATEKWMKNAINLGMANLFKDSTFQILLKDQSNTEKEHNFEKISILKPTNIVKNLANSVEASVTIKSKNGFGSGFFISNQGYIITNYHVISDTNKHKVILNNGKEYGFKIVRVSKINDIALLKVDIENEYSFSIDNKEGNIGEEVHVVGTNAAEDLSQSLSRGIISGIRKVSKTRKLIQTDASVNGGCSGGAIINKDCKVVGIVKSKIYGIGIEGIAFGIPSSEIQNKLNLVLK